MNSLDAASGVSACVTCGQVQATRGLFCERCGGSRCPETPQELWEWRIGRLGQMVRNQVWRGIAGTGLLTKPVKHANAMLTRHPSLPDRSPASAGMAQDLECLRGELDMQRRLAVIELLLPLLPAPQAELVRQEHAALKKFFNGLRDVERGIAEGKQASRDKLANWIEKQALAAGLSPPAAQQAIFTTVELWHRLAELLDADRFQQQRLDHEAALGRLELQGKNFESARQRFSAILNSNASFVPALEGLALVEVRSGNNAAALPLLERAIAIGTNDPMTFNNFAWYLCQEPAARHSDLTRARDAAERAVQLFPAGGQFDTLAEVLFQLGDLPGAMAATRECLRDDPQRESFKERMRLLCETLDRLQPVSPTIVDAAPFEAAVEIPSSDEADAAFAANEGQVSFDADDDFELALDDCAALSSDSGCSLDASDFELVDDTDWSASSVVSFDDDEAGDEWDASEAVEDAFGSVASQPGTGTSGSSIGLDSVWFSATYPERMLPAEVYVIDVWAHLEDQQDRVMREAERNQEHPDFGVKTKTGVNVARHSVLGVQVDVPGLVLHETDQTIVWSGEMCNALFPIEVPATARLGRYVGKVIVHCGGCELCRIPLLLTVAEAESKAPVQASPTPCYRSAFASYARADTDAVSLCLQGLLRSHPGLDLFWDRTSLRPGDDWKERLHSEIASRDVLYLFWSNAARDSEMVTWEWQTALEHKGIRGVAPIPLVSPMKCPPPQQLASLHFDDWLLAFRRDGLGERP